MLLKNVNTLTLNASDFASKLATLQPPVKTLFYKGASIESWFNRPKVAIVGSRKISPYGLNITYKIARELAKNNIIVISGLAYGVDVTAHKGALSVGGATIAVLPGGLDKIYPAVHLSVANEILSKNGGLISEYPAGSEIKKHNFILRNRIVSGLSDVIVITEAALGSGSLHTANFALEQGKTVMAVPGNITSSQSEGANNLLKSGAVVLTSVEDIFFELGYKSSKPKIINYRGLPTENLILSLISEGITMQDDLVSHSKLSGSEVNQALTGLEIAGVIKPLGRV